MSATKRPPLHPLADTSAAAVVAGFIAMLTGYTSSLVLMFQAGQAAGLSSGQISSAATCVGLSLRYRAPVMIAWSTPGAALLISSLPNVPYREAIGAYILSSALIVLCGLTGSFDRIMRRIPGSIAAALLAGVLFKIALEIGLAAEQQPLLVITMLLAYLLGKRLLPRYAVLAALLVGCALAGMLGLLNFAHFHLQVATPVWTTPGFSMAATISIGIPLFIVAMASQNLPGMTVLRANGYDVPASPLLTVTGLTSILLAPLGAHGIHMAAISAAICAGPEAHEDPQKRYTAAVWCGLFYGVAAIFGATLAALFAALPKALILSIAALALFSSIIGGLTQAMGEIKEREAALVTFLITASGMSLFGIGSAFWGIVTGLLTLMLLNAGKTRD
jgi:benzoate membrane transport protein